MHEHDMDGWRHSHDFGGHSGRAETSTRRVIALTAVMMVIEIVAGTASGSMALLADGWHMATHVAAFGITLFAYRYARIHATNPRYSYGTGKVGVLGGFASAVALAMVALMMALESGMRLIEPQAIHYSQAIGVAVAGLVVNLVCGAMLHDHHHDHDRAEDHDHDHDHGHHDHNLRAAYFHVLADALTSLFAIVALLAGKYVGWTWLDPVVGIIGALVIARWAWGLLRDSGHILLDATAGEGTQAAITRAIESDADNRIADLHVWPLGPRHYAASLSVVTHDPRPPEHYKALLREIPLLAHVVVEVNRCCDVGSASEGVAKPPLCH
ncbi:MAG: CDF family Co(II)/Ni(II) efflux transporter DmeF [Pseudomonadales bacterium]|jgi:cation diffusion facilitator family transporter|nr:CDF family Co(II)/Ni(II) efflux transporter DmeF [Gammaproteobacteria bacterium]MBP6482587.1 CDF family Co(II)/Ni(II) efflux transporter DmeF [Pseudomonadales bacterium]MBP7909435.1 CDF family Co(II)/Ni(II) efflux transporter DmeF [Pseudomonadales bacterium]